MKSEGLHRYGVGLVGRAILYLELKNILDLLEFLLVPKKIESQSVLLRKVESSPVSKSFCCPAKSGTEGEGGNDEERKQLR